MKEKIELALAVISVVCLILLCPTMFLGLCIGVCIGTVCGITAAILNNDKNDKKEDHRK